MVTILMAELTEREKELLGYIDKLLKFHALSMVVYSQLAKITIGLGVLHEGIDTNIKNIDPFGTMKNMIETLNRDFNTSYTLFGEEKQVGEVKQ